MSQPFKLIFATGLMSGFFTSTALAGNPAYAPQTPDLVPSNPVAGECYARVKIPAQYAEHPIGVKVEEGYETVEVTQPQLAARQESVLVKEPSVKFEVRQPTYRTVTEQIMVRPSYEKLSVAEPQFKTVTETVQTAAPRLVWKQGNPANLIAQGYKIHSTADGGRFGQGYGTTAQYASQGGTKCGPTCEIWCLVEEPAQTAAYTRKVLVNPGLVQRHSVPAKYQAIQKRIVADPGGVREIPIPAEYQTIIVEDVVAPAQEMRRYVEPRYAGMKTKTLISPERYEWRQVLCAPGTGSIGAGYIGTEHRTPTTYHGTQNAPRPTYANRSNESYISDVRLSGGYDDNSSHLDRAYTNTSRYGVMRKPLYNKTTEKRQPHRTRD